MIFTSRTLKLACVSVCAVSLAACGGHSAKKKSTPTPTPTPVTSTATTTAPQPAAINPLTGGKPTKNRVVAVKIDDTGNGRPQVGIDKADIVYIEQVEGGLTRLMAVYSTQLPTVEAVRSTRANDPELAEQFGHIAYVASGGAPNPLQVLARSSLRKSINDQGGPGFARDPNRPVPYNLTSNLALVARTLNGPTPQDIGLTWAISPSLVRKARHATSVQTVVGGTPVRFDYDAHTKRYVRVIDGAVQHAADGNVISTPNVIVQFCAVTPYPQDVDVVGNPAQFTHTVGKGRAVVFRNGHIIDGRWSRSKVSSGTAFRTTTGQRIPLAPGGVWIVLVATNAPLG
jgi:hypothetical protein